MLTNPGVSRRSLLQFGGHAAGFAAVSGLTLATVAAPATAQNAGAAEAGAPVEYHPTTPIQGTFKDRFVKVRDAFARNLDTGQDIGASVAVFVDGEPVVDLWGGYFDATYTRQWQRDTIVQTFSTTKTMTALCALVLADHGELDLNAPVAKYWPEFGAAGKADIELRQVLGHSSGVAGWSEPMTLADVCDWEKSTNLLASQAPWWTPGTAVGYHNLTIGHITGEVIRRVTGKTMGTFLAEELAGPLKANFHIGTGPEFDPQVSLLIQGFPIQPSGGRFFDKALLNPPIRHYDTWQIPWRRAEIGGANGHGNAYGIAALQSVVANGGALGKRLMSDAGRERVLERTGGGADQVLGLPISWGLGYCLNPEVVPAAAGRRAFWWAGNGGSMSWVDLDYRMSFGFAPNRWITGPHEQTRSTSILAAVYECLAA